MKIYAISGLGADKRVFDFLRLHHEIIPIDWIEPKEKETLKDYSLRLSQVIDMKSEFGLIGVSFGGLVAVEISKMLNPEFTILISSAEKAAELRPIYRIIGRLGLLQLLPPKIFDPPRKITHYLFGAKNKDLLNSILANTNLNFAKWAVNKLVNWDNQTDVKNLVRIHGTHDKLIPYKGSRKVILIERGEHFMIVDLADEVTKAINKVLR